MSAPLFLGLDSSTQSFKATVVDADLNLVFELALNFEKDLPQFNTTAGVIHGEDGLSVTSPTIMWVAALDLLLERMKEVGFDFGAVKALSGSGQQHGSVYWKKGALETLKGLNSEHSLEDQLKSSFAIEDSPVWMDSSTSAQCKALEEKLGGAQAVADLTGSRAYERFTGNQIAKVSVEQKEGYEKTERISLVSSFVACLFVGDYAGIDSSDGAGMNLMDIQSKSWASVAVDATAPGLADKLGEVVASHADVGGISDYFVARYGFDPSCRVIACSGDNPCSLAGLGLRKAGDIAISLGTSDTVFAALSDPKPSASEGHIFANPIDPDGYMALVCYKNGSMTREGIRNQAAEGSWEKFDAALANTPKGNQGRIGFYRKEPEITPPILSTGENRFDANGEAVDSFPADADVRAVVEGQFLSMRLHGANIGIEAKLILATGGASTNSQILQVIADVFGVEVFTAARPNSASLGAAYRALHGWRCVDEGKFVPFAEIMDAAPSFNLASSPDMEAFAVYTEMLNRYADLEAKVMAVTA
ncbi:xylulose kinase [Verrucomicrobia bacterium]|nr:xylulose kinase [Verrucomicrobiota bacterium]